jgi:transposase
VPALPSSVLEPLWVQVAALLPTRQVHHPLGCHRPRIPDRVVFDKLVQVLGLRLRLPPHRRPHLLGHHAAAPP